MKVYVLAPRENWICDRIASEWYSYFDSCSTHNLSEADVVWLQAGWCWNHIHPEILKSKKVVCTEHHIVPEKFTQASFQEFRFRDQFVDLYHVPNEHTEKVVRQLTDKPVSVLNYWYDSKKWYPEERVECKKELRLPEDKFIVGSFQRDSEGDTDKPKLEKGPDLFCDYIEKINMLKPVHVLLGGWRRKYVVNRLNASGINYTMFELASEDKLRKMYSSCDLYVVASRHEGGPQSLLEAPATMTPIITTDMGIARQVISNNCIVDIEKSVYFPEHIDVELNYASVLKYRIESHGLNYVRLFEEVCENV